MDTDGAAGVDVLLCDEDGDGDWYDTGGAVDLEEEKAWRRLPLGEGGEASEGGEGTQEVRG